MNKLTELRARTRTLFLPPQRRSDQGAGLVEYAAILILVAAIAIGVFGLGIHTLIIDAIDTAVDDILSGPSGGVEDVDE